jgi:hypothetical protein
MAYLYNITGGHHPVGKPCFFVAGTFVMTVVLFFWDDIN